MRLFIQKNDLSKNVEITTNNTSLEKELLDNLDKKIDFRKT